VELPVTAPPGMIRPFLIVSRAARAAPTGGRTTSGLSASGAAILSQAMECLRVYGMPGYPPGLSGGGMLGGYPGYPPPGIWGAPPGYMQPRVTECSRWMPMPMQGGPDARGADAKGGRALRGLPSRQDPQASRLMRIGWFEPASCGAPPTPSRRGPRPPAPTSSTQFPPVRGAGPVDPASFKETRSDAAGKTIIRSHRKPTVPT